MKQRISSYFEIIKNQPNTQRTWAAIVLSIRSMFALGQFCLYICYFDSVANVNTLTIREHIFCFLEGRTLLIVITTDMTKLFVFYFYALICEIPVRKCKQRCMRP